MRYLHLELSKSKLALTQFAPHTSDPKLHGHGDELQVSIPLIGSPYLEHGESPRIDRLPDVGRFVTGPGEQHRHFARDEAARVLLLNFKFEFLEDVLRDRLHHLPASLEFASWGDGPNDPFRKIAERLMKRSLSDPIDGIESHELEWELAQTLLSTQSGTHTAYWKRTPSAHHHPALTRTLEAIHDTHATDLSLDGLAHAAGLSKFHLLRLFRDTLGRTPGQYIHEVRLERAEQLLATTEMDVITICFEVGYGSLSSMERAFKNKHTVTPTEYRRQRRI